MPMKRYNSLLLLFLIALLTNAEEKPKFYMAYAIECKPEIKLNIQDKLFMLENTIGAKLEQAFPCISLKTQNSVEQRLDDLRKICLLNDLPTEDIQKTINDIGGDVDCQYLVHLSLNAFNENTVTVACKVMNMKKAKTMANAFSSGTLASLGSKTAEELAEKIIDDLKEYEICAFQGPVAITISADLDSTSVEDYAVYCNEGDQRYHKEIVIKNHTFSEWKLDRKGISWTEGTMTFYTDELSQTTEEDGCHKCKSGREGGLVTTIKSAFNVKGTGISHKSEYQGNKQDDTRIELKFLENGTYLVVASGTSQPVTGQDVVTKSAQGTCDNEPENTKPVPREITVPLKVIFGPYTGKASDKELKERDEKKIKDPVTREEQSVTIDFSLKQQEN